MWQGFVAELPHSEAKEIPPALSSKGGGPLAVRPSSDPNHLLPQSQVYLLSVDIENPDGAIALGTLAHVKIHPEYRSAAWWIWRTVNSVFDVPLL